MKKPLIYLFIALVSFISSCDETDFIKKVPESQLPEYVEELALYCYLSPESDSIEVYITDTEPIYKTYQDIYYDYNPDLMNDEYYEYVLNAVPGVEVIISNETGEQVVLPFDETKGIYAIPTSAFPIVEGGKYFLEANLDQHHLTAECEVTFKNESMEVTVEEKEFNDGYGTYSGVVFKVTFDVPEGDPSYYRVGGYFIQEYPSNDPNVISNYLDVFQLYFRENLIDASGKEGSQITIVQEGEFYGYEDAINSEWVFFLMSTDYTYYQFHYDEENYFGDNPFVEPRNFYSNINGGIGVFAAYNPYIVSLENEF